MLRRHLTYFASGSLHFVTTVTRIRGARFVEDRVCRAVLELFEGYRRKYGVACGGYVLMPDHFHALLMQSNPLDAVLKLMRDFKKMTSLKCNRAYDMGPRLWSDGYDDVPVPGSNAVHTKLHYIHFNPVRAGLVASPEDYSWSSARDYAEAGKGIVELVFARWS